MNLFRRKPDANHLDPVARDDYRQLLEDFVQ